MNICLIGDNLTTLTLAKNLVNKQINVSIYCNSNKKSKFYSRTIGISKDNFDFFNNKIIKIENKLLWKIEQIEVLSEKFENKKILNFDQNIFFMIQNHKVYKLLNNDLKKNKYFKKTIIKKKTFFKNILKEKNYDLIINCENNSISKTYFNERIKKNYNSSAYTSIIEHQNIKNSIARQIFTKKGPIAFLPISNTKTSVVFSIMNNGHHYEDKEIKELINHYNNFYKIKKINNFEKFDLSLSIAKRYYYKNIMAFGDTLHKIHPLAGQGFNMTLRDIRILSKIIQERVDLGLRLDSSVYEEFENTTKHLNLFFSFGIDFIYQFFKFDNKYKNNYLNHLLKFVIKNKMINKLISNYADKGNTI